MVASQRTKIGLAHPENWPHTSDGHIAFQGWTMFKSWLGFYLSGWVGSRVIHYTWSNTCRDRKTCSDWWAFHPSGIWHSGTFSPRTWIFPDRNLSVSNEGFLCSLWKRSTYLKRVILPCGGPDSVHTLLCCAALQVRQTIMMISGSYRGEVAIVLHGQERNPLPSEKGPRLAGARSHQHSSTINRSTWISQACKVSTWRSPHKTKCQHPNSFPKLILSSITGSKFSDPGSVPLKAVLADTKSHSPNTLLVSSNLGNLSECKRTPHLSQHASTASLLCSTFWLQWYGIGRALWMCSVLWWCFRRHIEVWQYLLKSVERDIEERETSAPVTKLEHFVRKANIIAGQNYVVEMIWSTKPFGRDYV